MKKTYYFSHDFNARHDPKLVELQMKFGMEGIGVYWCIIEMLYEQNGKIRTHHDRIAFELRTQTEIVEWIISESELFKIDGDFFYSESVLRRLNEQSKKSEKARESVNSRWGKYERNTNVIRMNNESNTIKERKGKEKKGKESKGVTRTRVRKTPPIEFSFPEYSEIHNELTAPDFITEISNFNEWDHGKFGEFALKWIEKKRISGDYSYPMARLKSFLIKDFEAENNRSKQNYRGSEFKRGIRSEIDSTAEFGTLKS